MNEPDASAAGSKVSSLPRTFGGYELLEEIGRGGMGVIYRARQCCLDRLCAVKMLRAEGHAGPNGPEAEASLRAEAAAAGRLDHPNIVAVFEVGREEGQLFFSMEYIEGEDLGRYTRSRLLDPPTIARLMVRIADAIAYAHDRGVMHHDLKPANVVIDPQGEPQITDFGLARRVDEARRTDPTRGAGSPNYISPEQASARFGEPGFAADVFGLGAILYFLLTDRPPFVGLSAEDTLRAALETDPIDPGQLRRGVPRDLATICLKCLQKQPSKRYASAREVADELRRFLADEPIRARRAGIVERGRKLCRRHPVIAGLTSVVALLLITLAFGASVAAMRIHEARMRAEASELATRQHLYNADMLLASAALAAGNDGQVRELVRRYQPSQSAGAGGADLRGWEWRHLQHAAEGDVASKVGKHSEAVVQLAANRDGRIVVAADNGGELRTWDLADARQVGSRRIAPAGGPIFALAGHHDWLLTVARAPEATNGPALVLALPDLRTVHEIPLPDRRWAGGFTADDRSVWLLGDDDIAEYDVADGRPGRRHPVPRVERGRDFAVAPGGTLLALADRTGSIGLWDLTEGRHLATCEGHAFQPIWGQAIHSLQFSPDGRLLVSAGADGTVRLWSVETGRSIRTYTGHSDLVMAVAFSADGRQVVSSGRDSFLQRFEVAADPSTTALRLRGADAVQSAVCFLPDGQTAISGGLDGSILRWRSSPRADARILFPLPPDTAYAVPLLDGEHFAAYTAKFDATVRRFSDGRIVRTFDGDATWLAGGLERLRDGRLLAVFLDRDRVLTVSNLVDGTRISRPVELGRPPNSRRLLQVGLSPDGKSVVMADVLEGLWVFDSSKLETVHRYEGHAQVIAFSGDGRRLAAGALAGVVRIHDLSGNRGSPIPAINHPQLANLAFSPDDRLLATVGFDGAARLWNLEDGKELARLPTSAGNLYGVAWLPDGSRLFVGSLSGVVSAWDLHSLREAFLFRGHAQPITALAAHPDGTLYSLAPDGVRAWPAPAR